MATFSHKLKTVEEENDHEKPQEPQIEEPVRECIITFVHMNMFLSYRGISMCACIFP